MSVLKGARGLRAFARAARERYGSLWTPACKIYDCFTYFNERELLEFRIDYLKDVVDYFVIVEGDRTHSGMPKEQNFRIDRFDASVRGMIRYQYISFPEHMPDPVWTSGDSEENRLAWKREGYQRMRLMDGLADAGQEDIVVVTDLDEIPNRDRLRELKKDNRIASRNSVVALEMSAFFYDINGLASYANGTAFRWRHPKLATRKNLECTGKVRLAPPDAIIPDGGWHFTYFGGPERVKNKLRAYSHIEAATPENLTAVEERLGEHRDIVGREEFAYSDSFDKSKLPRLVFSEKYRHFFEGGKA